MTTVDKTGRAVFIIVGLINFIPLIGVISSAQLSQMYGIQLESPDILILLRHRAILFGLLGGFILYAAFNRPLQPLASVAALVAMVSFVVFVYSTETVSDELHKVAIVDIVAIIILLGWLITGGRANRNVIG